MIGKLLVISGPTATGKTSLGISLAKEFNGEIVSADSRQVYRGLDIGTGKDLPSGAEFRELIKLSPTLRMGFYLIGGIKTWLLDLTDPDVQINVSDWLKVARLAISDIWQRNKLPIIVGGTGFYIKGLVGGIETVGIPQDKELRKALEGFSLQELKTKLAVIAPEVFWRMNKSDRENPRRLVRKIEIALSKKEPKKKTSPLGNVDLLQVGLRAENKVLYKRIDQRVRERLDQGLIEEIKGLLKKGIRWSEPGMDTLGYKEFKEFLKGKESLEEAVEKWQNDEHGYARRQMTWFKKQEGINWFDISQKEYQKEIEKLVKRWYSESNYEKTLPEN